MPNWCCTNYVIRGSKEDLETLVNTLNTMENHKTDFGRYWMGNLLIALGVNENDVYNGEIRCRGAFDPDPYAYPQLCGPNYDENAEFCIDDDGLLRMSATHAWCRSEDMEEFLKTKFPSLEFFFFSTDEFGNFHLIHDPEDLGSFDAHELHVNYEYFEYRRQEAEKFIADFKKACPGLEIPDTIQEIADEEFEDRFSKWREADPSREDIFYYVSTEV